MLADAEIMLLVCQRTLRIQLAVAIAIGTSKLTTASCCQVCVFGLLLVISGPDWLSDGFGIKLV